MLNFSWWTPTLGASLKWNDQKRPKLAHFGIFRRIGGGPKNCGPQNIVGEGEL